MYCSPVNAVPLLVYTLLLLLILLLLLLLLPLLIPLLFLLLLYISWTGRYMFVPMSRNFKTNLLMAFPTLLFP